MASTIDVPVRSSSLTYRGDSLPGEWHRLHDHDLLEPAGMVQQTPFWPFNGGRVEMLLDEPAFALWATEASRRFEVSAIDALELLAYALFLDGER
jgi:hypothetical protein